MRGADDAVRGAHNGGSEDRVDNEAEEDHECEIATTTAVANEPGQGVQQRVEAAGHGGERMHGWTRARGQRGQRLQQRQVVPPRRA